MAIIICPECGKEVSDKANACPVCGYPIGAIQRCTECGSVLGKNDKACGQCGCPASDVPQDTGTANCRSSEESVVNESTKAISEKEKSCNSTPETTTSPSEKGSNQNIMHTDRNALVIMLLSLITLGIYGVYFYATVVRDINHACKEDGKITSGLIKMYLLSLVTLGIYGIYWMYQVCERTHNYEQANITESGLALKKGIKGSTYLLWSILGSLLFGVGPIVALCLFIRNLNNISKIYNSTPASYSEMPKPDLIPVYIFGGLSAISIIGSIIISVIMGVSSLFWSDTFDDYGSYDYETEASSFNDNSRTNESNNDNIAPSTTASMYAVDADYFFLELPEDYSYQIDYLYDYDLYLTCFDEDGNWLFELAFVMDSNNLEGYGDCHSEHLGTASIIRMGEFQMYAIYYDEYNYYGDKTYEDYVSNVASIISTIDCQNRGDIYWND